MGINIKSTIEDGEAVKAGGFSGAVFLTYTLNLGFFENIIGPSLERAGCSNVLIISDPDGYAEALEMGQKNVSYAGMRYVCAPITRKGNGVQHAKILFMAGPERGRLLVGSGNLTLYGYSQNLEVFSHYEFNSKDPEPEAYYALITVWNMIKKLGEEEKFSSTAKRQIDVISEHAEWLEEPPFIIDNFSIWNNLEKPIWSQFTHWYERHKSDSPALKELHLFSPYYDQNVGMLQEVIEYLKPVKANLYLSKENTTLNGKNFNQQWQKSLPEPSLFDIRETNENQGQRLLHAKLIVGIEENGSWCIAGSANMTRAALAKSWEHGGNLEMVTFRWSNDPQAFDYFFDHPLTLHPLDLNNFEGAGVSDFSEQPRKVFSDSILLTELTLQNKSIVGKLNRWPGTLPAKAELVFVRSGEKYDIQLEHDLHFQHPFLKKIDRSESAYIQRGNFQSLPRWIDLPDILQDYGSRSYQERIQSKLDTVVGAESLFRELLEFLFNRVSPNQITPVNNSQIRIHQQGKSKESDSKEEETPAPAPDRFVVPERDEKGAFKIGGYTKIPYNQNIHSLRDLLSIVLLKLLPDSESTSTEESGEDDINNESKGGEDKARSQKQIEARVRLCNYLNDYCKRYSRRLVDKDFISDINPAFLFDNHFTLSRILLEFVTNVDEFSQTDLQRCYWLIWAPLFWPSIVGLEGKSSWQLYDELELSIDFVEKWKLLNMSSLFVTMTYKVFGQPPSWSTGLYAPDLAKKFLVLQKLVEKISNCIGDDIDNVNSIDSIGISQVDWEESVKQFKKIAAYLSPAKERLTPILEWVIDGKKEDSQLNDRIYAENLEDEFSAYLDMPRPIKSILTEIDFEGFLFCPNCGGALQKKVVSDLNKGKMVLCSMSSDVWLYKIEKLPNKMI